MELTTEIEEAPAGERGQSLGELGWAARTIDANGMVTSVTAVTEKSARRLELDGLRGVAILIVVFSHVVQGVSGGSSGLAPWIGSHGGRVGVQLFFVLSGFLITGVLMRGGGLVAFYQRRWRRLYPTLLVVVVVAFLWSRDLGSAFRALTYTENIPGVQEATGSWGAEHPLGHTWSLAVEEQFYLLWPLVMLVAGRHAAKVAAVGILTVWWLQHTVGWSSLAIYMGLRWDAVLAGCLIALVGWKGTRPLFVAGAVILAMQTLGLAGLGRSDFLVLTVASGVVVAHATQVRWLRARLLGHLGHLSYALYLWHVLVMRLELPMAVTLPLSVVLAEVTYLLVDKTAQAGRSGRLAKVDAEENRVLSECVGPVRCHTTYDYAAWPTDC